jgi:preprotein translocase subunit SecA
MNEELSYSEPKPVNESPYWWVSHMSLLKNTIIAYWVRCRYQKELRVVNDNYAQLKTCETSFLIEQLWQKKTVLSHKNRTNQKRSQFLELVAIVKAIVYHQMDVEPYDVQVLSVLAMYDGYLVQLAPGEGKTITIGFLAVLFGMANKPCHVITSNDYLAQRDAELLTNLFKTCRLSVGSVLQTMNQEEKRINYQCALVYSTAKQLLADFLTDQITFKGKVNQLKLSMNYIQGKNIPLLMRGLHSVIIDEADNIMIDEAITPMIISGPDHNPLLRQAIELAHLNIGSLYPHKDYHLDEHFRDVTWTKLGHEKLARIAATLPGLWQAPERYEDLFSQAVLARDYFIENQHYVIDHEQVVIVDEGTGRPMPGRTWSYGLHQAIEKKAGVPLSEPNKTLAKMSFQNYFKFYHRITGASGTLQGVNFELFHNYRKQILAIPSRLQSRLKVHRFQVFKNRYEKMEGIFYLAHQLHSRGIPVLIGTKRIDDSEALANIFKQNDIPFQLLNAKKLAEEAQIVESAGKLCGVTIATNMAGRGTDIKLSQDVVERGGLRVIMYEPHESRRIDWQLFGRAGRQGQPGEVFPMCSLDDELFKKNFPKWGKGILHSLQIITRQMILWDWLIYFCQKRAEHKSFRLRKFINYASDESRKKMSFTHIE